MNGFPSKVDMAVIRDYEEGMNTKGVRYCIIRGKKYTFSAEEDGTEEDKHTPGKGDSQCAR